MISLRDCVGIIFEKSVSAHESNNPISVVWLPVVRCIIYERTIFLSYRSNWFQRIAFQYVNCSKNLFNFTKYELLLPEKSTNVCNALECIANGIDESRKFPIWKFRRTRSVTAHLASMIDL